MLTFLGFFIFLQVYGLCLPVHPADFRIGLLAAFPHTESYQTSGQRNRSDIMSRTRLDSYNISFLQMQAIGVAIISLSGILKLDFDHFLFVGITRNIGQPVIGIQLVVLTAATPATQRTATIL